MKNLKEAIIYWIPLAVTITCLSGLIYTVVQQDIRLSANNPQIQIAEDTADSLMSGTPINTLIPTNKVNINKSLSTFVIIYDNLGNVIASSAELNSQTPSLPKSVLTNISSNNEDKITWEPESGVRIAAVIVKFNNPQLNNKSLPPYGYVLAGRSIIEAENLEDIILHDVILGWALTMLVSLASALLVKQISYRKLK